MKNHNLNISQLNLLHTVIFQSRHNKVHAKVLRIVVVTIKIVCKDKILTGLFFGELISTFALIKCLIDQK